MIRSHNLFHFIVKGFTLSANSSIRSFELCTFFITSSIDFWQAERPAISFCMVSRELRGVDSTLALHPLPELILDVELPDVDGVLNAE